MKRLYDGGIYDSGKVFNLLEENRMDVIVMIKRYLSKRIRSDQGIKAAVIARLGDFGE